MSFAYISFEQYKIIAGTSFVTSRPLNYEINIGTADIYPQYEYLNIDVTTASISVGPMEQ